MNNNVCTIVCCNIITDSTSFLVVCECRVSYCAQADVASEMLLAICRPLNVVIARSPDQLSWNTLTPNLGEEEAIGGLGWYCW